MADYSLDPLAQRPLPAVPLSIALMLSPGDQTGPGAEVKQPGYSRQLISFVPPSDAPPGVPMLANVATTEWPRATSLWGDIGWLTAYLADGTYFGWGTVVSPFDEITPEIIRIDRGDVCRFRASGMRITEGYQPPRPYGVGPYSKGRYARSAAMLAVNGSVSGAFLPGDAPCSGASGWVLEALP
jgi:hypothetical protein